MGGHAPAFAGETAGTYTHRSICNVAVRCMIFGCACISRIVFSLSARLGSTSLTKLKRYCSVNPSGMDLDRYSMGAYLSHGTIDDASLSRRSTI